MKSTVEQTAKRRELKTLVDELGNIAWQRNPNIAPCAIISHQNTPPKPGAIDYDEFFVFGRASRLSQPQRQAVSFSSDSDAV